MIVSQTAMQHLALTVAYALEAAAEVTAAAQLLLLAAPELHVACFEPQSVVTWCHLVNTANSCKWLPSCKNHRMCLLWNPLNRIPPAGLLLYDYSSNTRKERVQGRLAGAWQHSTVHNSAKLALG
jgi:hypothetical protein